METEWKFECAERITNQIKYEDRPIHTIMCLFVLFFFLSSLRSLSVYKLFVLILLFIVVGSAHSNDALLQR